MPGYASWKTLYKDEYFQLFEEGYPVGNLPQPDLAAEYLPFPAEVRGELKEENISEEEWEKAYQNLWKVRENGIRPGYPYNEPDDLESILRLAAPQPDLEPLGLAEYEQRLKGAWFGRCAGVVLGKPLEMGYDRLAVRKYLESVGAYPLDDWVPARSEKLGITLRTDCVPSTRGNVQFMQSDDDIHYTICALLLAEQKGLDFTCVDVGNNLLENIPYNWLWVADNQAYYHMVNLSPNKTKEENVSQIPLKLNPWRECMDGQLKCDLWGSLTPADPRLGAKYAHRLSSFSLVKNGIYGGMYVSGCISAALSRNPTPEKIIRGGLSVIPENSRLAEAVRNVMKWHSQEKDWIAVCDKIYANYGHWYFAAAINNLCWVTLAVLHGGLDYTRTITTAVMCGTDTDCNSGTAASIVGAAVGYDHLDPHWVEPLHDTVKSGVAGFGTGSISELVQRTLALRQKLFG